MAILAGDALLTLAFKLLAENGTHLNLPTKRFHRLISAVSDGAGTMGMIGGQVADIQSDKGRWRFYRYKANRDGLKAALLLDYIHQNKTAALIRTSLEVGAILGRGTEHQISALKDFGDHIGLPGNFLGLGIFF